MVLSEDQIKRVKSQTGAFPIPEDHTALETLVKRFGQHSFFLDDTGLHVFQPVQPTVDSGEKLLRISLAVWDGEVKTKLIPRQEPDPGQVVDISNSNVQFESEGN